jgi:hypothetical protein
MLVAVIGIDCGALCILHVFANYQIPCLLFRVHYIRVCHQSLIPKLNSVCQHNVRMLSTNMSNGWLFKFTCITYTSDSGHTTCITYTSDSGQSTCITYTSDSGHCMHYIHFRQWTVCMHYIHLRQWTLCALHTLQTANSLCALYTLQTADTLCALYIIQTADSLHALDTLQTADSLHALDTLQTADSLQALDTLPTVDSLHVNNTKFLSHERCHLMMGTEWFPETLCFLSELTQLTAREDFITSCHMFVRANIPLLG